MSFSSVIEIISNKVLSGDKEITLGIFRIPIEENCKNVGRYKLLRTFLFKFNKKGALYYSGRGVGTHRIVYFLIRSASLFLGNYLNLLKLGSLVDRNSQSSFLRTLKSPPCATVELIIHWVRELSRLSNDEMIKIFKVLPEWLISLFFEGEEKSQRVFLGIDKIEWERIAEKVRGIVRKFNKISFMSDRYFSYDPWFGTSKEKGVSVFYVDDDGVGIKTFKRNDEFFRGLSWESVPVFKKRDKRNPYLDIFVKVPEFNRIYDFFNRVLLEFLFCPLILYPEAIKREELVKLGVSLYLLRLFIGWESAIEEILDFLQYLKLKYSLNLPVTSLSSEALYLLCSLAYITVRPEYPFSNFFKIVRERINMEKKSVRRTHKVYFTLEKIIKIIAQKYLEDLKGLGSAPWIDNTIKNLEKGKSLYKRIWASLNYWKRNEYDNFKKNLNPKRGSLTLIPSHRSKEIGAITKECVERVIKSEILHCFYNFAKEVGYSKNGVCVELQKLAKKEFGRSKKELNLFQTVQLVKLFAEKRIKKKFPQTTTSSYL